MEIRVLGIMEWSYSTKATFHLAVIFNSCEFGLLLSDL